MNWLRLYNEALGEIDSAAGYYNRNVRVVEGSKAVNVRIPMRDAEVMDLRIWSEPEVLAAIAMHIPRIPRLLHDSRQPAFQVHQFIEGQVLDGLSPRGVAVPAHVVPDVAQFFVELSTVTADELPPFPDGWPRNDDTPAFARRLSDFTHNIFDRHWAEFEDIYAAFGVPADPLLPVEASWDRLGRRRLVCVHADIHRKNMIVQDNATYLLDWELALWGDPVYDLAVHIHKMDYIVAERERLLQSWMRALPEECSQGWEGDLDLYLHHEEVKSAIVDSVRSCHAFAKPGYSRDGSEVIVDKLTRKLKKAHNVWGIGHDTERSVVEATLNHWASTHVG